MYYLCVDATNLERMTVTFSPDASVALAKLRERTGYNKTDLINRALQVYEHLDSETRAGNQLVIAEPDGTIYRLRFL